MLLVILDKIFQSLQSQLDT